MLGPKTPRYPLGFSDYRELRRNGYSYVDKTGFGADVLAGDAKELLFPRPRRFGKTLNICMQRALEQLRRRDYAAELRAAGASEVHELAVVFDSKVCAARKP